MEALALSFVEGILSKLGSSSVSFLPIQYIFCFGDEKKKLISRLKAIEARLLDAEKQRDQTHTDKDLIQKLQLILYEADDLVEEIKLYETADVEGINKLCWFFKSTIPFHLMMPFKLKEIRDRLADFAAERAELPHSGRDEGCRNRNEETRMEPQPYIRSADIIGREKDKEAIKNMLKESSMSSNRSNVPIIIAIIGMGGLGKTTLAQSVYNDAEGFDLKIMVWVSQNFDVKRLLIEVIEAATKEKCQLTGMIQLGSKLRECLDGKKYLLVLDDIWNTNSVSWNDLGNLLKGGAKGSVILATAREKDVASIMGADLKHQYELKGLDEGDCWSLFEQQLRFKIDQMEEKHKFVAIGKEILNKCGGIPLAIMTVVGLLRCLDPEEWLNVKNDRLWSQAQEENQILPSLKVSYARLPSNLKKCFAYCSLFDRGVKIEKMELTQLWIAQGFIDHHSNNGLLVDGADKCFKELRNRSFLQDEENDVYGDVTSCKMHDLMYDLALEVAGSECIIVNDDGVPNISERIIHANVDYGILPTEEARNLRTLLKSCIFDDTKPDFYTTFKRLRVLELYIPKDNPNVLNSLRKLVHLRYLDLSNSDIRMLPNSICKLRYLQTLKLNCCYFLEELPGDIKKLTSLIHLENEGCGSLKGMPLGIGQLTSIQTLSEFVLGGKGWAGLSELEGLNNLGGSLKIKNLEKLEIRWETSEMLKGMALGIGQLNSIQTSFSEFVLGGKGWAGLIKLGGLKNLRGDLYDKILQNARNAISQSTKAFYLKDKKHLQSLTLWWWTSHEEVQRSVWETFEDEWELDVALLKSLLLEGQAMIDFALLESLQPNPHLKLLHIWRYGGVKFPSWMGKSLPNLVEIRLYFCPSCECLPLFVDQLPSLKLLTLYDLPKLEYIRSYVSDSSFPPTSSSSPSNSDILSGAAGFFPALKKVSLENLPKLKEWSIEVIVGDDGGKLKTDSAAATQPKRLLSLNTLSTLSIQRCPELTSMPSFPNIEELSLDGFSRALIQSMTMAETTSSLTSFLTHSKLKSLIIKGCKDLASLPSEIFTSLDRLSIRDCEELESLSRETPHMTKDLKGKAFDFPEEEEEEEDLQSFKKLRSLELENLPKLSSLPRGLQHATKLELHIHSCDGLVNWLDSMGNITSLHSLVIHGFQTLTSLPQGLRRLTALENLGILGCLELNFSDEDNDIPVLATLRSLKMIFLPKLASLPELLLNTTALKNLEISYCQGLVSLPDWLGNVTSLQQLEIRNCYELKSIPETMCRLTALQKLHISDCPQLPKTHRDYKVSPKIAHIPKISIDRKYLQGSPIIWDRRNSLS